MTLEIEQESNTCKYCDLVFTDDQIQWNKKNIERHIECCQNKLLNVLYIKNTVRTKNSSYP